MEKSSLININEFTDWKAQIRKNIYLHSSDCEIFRGEPGDHMDIFYAPEGKGKGKWALREYKIDN
ncbi:hypothetical protein LCM20_16760 [Halobacillus litoralis]|uniref:hypothetical protein n=1 Tax=Halobacillus litoralis TaxID=45668 RepID=UPI001CD5B102|nr:hypothetical protein [Halobacillus litoralis]MCA0972262.1 hypothetical protein [Halobacillus litoralis]